MLDDLELSTTTKKLVLAYLSKPTHALVLSGEVGSGLSTLASSIASELVANKSGIINIEPENGLISVETIRTLYERTRSIQHTRITVVIDSADTMSEDAQNSLLKLLEEPVENVHFILTTHWTSRLLPTIKSRTQSIDVSKISTKQTKKMLDAYKFDPKKNSQILFLADGLPAEISRLSNDEEYFNHRSAEITTARKILESSLYDRLTLIKPYTDRQSALQLLASCSKLLTFSVLKQRQYHSIDILPHLETASVRILENGHVRTQLMALMTKLG